MHRLLVILVLPWAAACTESAQPAQDTQVPKVVASLYPFAWLASEIAPDADVSQLAPGAADPHGAQLTPSEVASVREADVVIHVGDVGYQPQLEQAVEEAGGTVVAALDVVEPLPVEEGHAEHGEEEGHEELAADPHVWHSPSAMISIAQALAEALGQVNPAQEASYSENLDALVAELRRVAAEEEATLTDCTRDEVIVSHAGYGYLLEPHGIAQHAISPPEEHAEPSAQRLNELANEIREEGVEVILSEPVEGRDAAEALARETGAEIDEVLPLGGVTAEQAERGYPALFTDNLRAFARAAGCGSP